MKSLLVSIWIVASLTAAHVALSSPPSAGSSEIIYRICFPAERETRKPEPECVDEDCGLADGPPEFTDPLIEKNRSFSFLGATDYGMLWGSGSYRVIGDDRVRVLLYVIPTTAVEAADELMYSQNPDRMIRNAFFSSSGGLEDTMIAVSSRLKGRTAHWNAAVPEDGVLQMIDLHCGAKKMKIYDNHTLYYRTEGPSSRSRRCVELLWEKPEAPLAWQPVSSMTVGILTDAYCGEKK